jgi:hypothetical protein
MPNINSANFTNELVQIGSALEANAGDFPHMEAERLELKGLTQEIIDLTRQQDALNAKSQQTTKDLSEKRDRSQVLFVQLRNAVKAKYGTRNEKLTEFRLRPLGGRRSVRPKAKTPKATTQTSDQTTTTPPTQE